MATEHTQPPWRALRVEKAAVGVADGSGKIICDCLPTDYRAQDRFEPAVAASNAAFIVRAVNCHDELLAALERLVEETPFDSDIDDCECGEYGNGRDEAGNVCEHIQAHRAIAKARGE